MKHLGLSTKQTGMLWALHRSVGVVATPLSGAVADKTGKPKTVLCTLLACSAIVAMSMAFVPMEQHHNTFVTNSTGLVCYGSSLANQSSFVNQHHEKIMTKCTSNTSVGTDVEIKGVSNYSDHRFQLIIEPCDCAAIKSINLNHSGLSCAGFCNDAEDREDQVDRYGITFWSMFCLFLLASVFYPGCTPAIDASSFAILGKSKSHKFGQQRLFGSIGFGTAAFIIGTIKNTISSNMADPSSSNLPFYPAFFGALFFWLTSAVVASKLAISNSKSQPIALSNIKVILQNGQILSFLIFIALFFGYAHAVTFSYEYWLLEEKLHASSLVLGMASLVGSLSDIPCYLLSGYFIRRFGHKIVLVFGMMTFTLRLFLFTVITAAWQIILVDVLYGITWGMNWSVICSYASVISPPSLEYTTMAVVQTTTHGIGWSTGALLGGHIFSVMGSEWMFRVTALMVACAAVLYAIIVTCYHVKISRQSKQQTFKTQTKTADINGNNMCQNEMLYVDPGAV
ncbi:major facilitator superfamily domain-containing protein 6-like [Ciona intestinalis]